MAFVKRVYFLCPTVLPGRLSNLEDLALSIIQYFGATTATSIEGISSNFIGDKLTDVKIERSRTMSA